MKEVLAEAGVPTARYRAFDDFQAGEALEFLESLPGPWVVKTDGLAAGKGVRVARTLDEAREDVMAKLSGAAFGDAGRTVVIEEGLEGDECSLLVLCDGTRVVPLLPAQDFKRVGDDDTGPNTGGMGAYAPMHLDAATVDGLLDVAVLPLVEELRRRGIDYRGVLYAGLMLTEDGPKVIEYNVRFGDPETQVVLPLARVRRRRPLPGRGERHASTRSSHAEVPGDAAVCVVLASPGYPDAPRRATPSTAWPVGPAVSAVEGVTVFHAGTRRHDADARFYTAGGPVLDVTAVAPTLAEARRNAYDAVARTIDWEGRQMRRDIAAAAAAGRQDDR